MEAQYAERKNRIKLRVLTSTGLNLLCTANRSQKVKQLLPHIIKLYEEVKEDQGLNDPHNHVTKPFIKFIRKQEFLIAPSELVGDIFDDNDQIFCEIADQSILNLGTKTTKKQSKQQSAVKTDIKPLKTKKIKKKNSKQQAETKNKQRPQTPVDKTETQQQKYPKDTEKMIVEAENQHQMNEQKPTEIKQKNIETKPSNENKKKKHKNNKKNKPQGQSVQQKGEVKVPESNPSEIAKPNVKKTQLSSQKSTPLLSNDQVAKFIQLMKKPISVENNQ